MTDTAALLKDLRWRMNDVRDMLMTRRYGGDGESIYGCDEWSTPTVNLQTAINVVDKALAALSAEQPAGEAWQDIATAPKHIEVLVYRDDAGTPFICRLTTPDAVCSDKELEQCEFPDDFEEWFSDAYGWQEGSEKPTHWMPLPPAPGASPIGSPKGGDGLTEQWRANLHNFLDAAAGEGYTLGGVDAAALYEAVFPDEYAIAASRTADKGER